jgi:hypothetical protein
MDQITHQSPRQQGYGSTSSLRNDFLKHTRKHERKEGGIEPRNKAARLWRTVQLGGADCSQSPHGQSGQVPRIVRKDHADRSTRSYGLSVKANKTTRTDPRKTDRTRRPGGPSARVPDRLLPKLGPSANQLQRKPKTKPDQTETKQEHEEHHDELGLTSLTVRGEGADCPPG